MRASAIQIIRDRGIWKMIYITRLDLESYQIKETAVILLCRCLLWSLGWFFFFVAGGLLVFSGCFTLRYDMGVIKSTEATMPNILHMLFTDTLRLFYHSHWNNDFLGFVEEKEGVFCLAEPLRTSLLSGNQMGIEINYHKS